MARKFQKKAVFQIYQFSIRNYMTLANFVILLTTLIALCIGLVYAFFFTPQFQATGMLQNQPYNSVNEVADNPLNQNQINSANIIREMDLLQTYDVLSKVVEHLHLNIEVKPQTTFLFGDLFNRLHEELQLSEFLVGKNINWLGQNGERIEFKTIELPRNYIGQKILLTVEGENNFKIKLPNNQILSGSINQLITFPNGKIEISAIYGQVGQTFVLTQRSIIAASEELAKNLDINIPNYLNKQNDTKSILAQNLITIQYVSRNPIQAAAVVNTLLDQAIIADAKRKTQEAANTVRLLEVQQNLVKNTIDQLNLDLVKLKSENNPLDSTAEGQYMLQQLSNINDELRQADQKRVELSQTLTNDNPQLITMNQQIQNLLKAKTTLEQKIVNTPSALKNITNLQNDLLANTQVNTKLTYQIQQLKAMQKAAIGDLQIVQKAEVPMVNIAYARWVYILLSLGIGYLLGYVLSLALI